MYVSLSEIDKHRLIYCVTSIWILNPLYLKNVDIFDEYD